MLERKLLFKPCWNFGESFLTACSDTILLLVPKLLPIGFLLAWKASCAGLGRLKMKVVFQEEHINIGGGQGLIFCRLFSPCSVAVMINVCTVLLMTSSCSGSYCFCPKEKQMPLFSRQMIMQRGLSSS